MEIKENMETMENSDADSTQESVLGTQNSNDIVVCQNCGARYNANENVCPYCGFENAELATEAFEQEVDAKQDAIIFEMSKPQRFLAAFKKNTVWIVLFCLILISVLSFIGIFKQVNDPVTYEVSEKYLDELEQARIDKDYETIKNLVYDNSLYKGKYIGYSNLSTVYSDYSRYEENLQKADTDMNEEIFMSEEVRYLSVEIDIAWSIHYGLRAIRSASEFIEKDTFYGTEDDIKALKNDIMAQFSEWEIDEELVGKLTEEMENDSDAIANEDSLIWKKAVSIVEGK